MVQEHSVYYVSVHEMDNVIFSCVVKTRLVKAAETKVVSPISNSFHSDMVFSTSILVVPSVS